MATQQQSTQNDPVSRPREAARYLGFSRSTLYELVDRGLLEEPIPLGVRAVGWRLSTLNAYLGRQIRRAMGDE
jgi:excisionase family DNA binding protein